MTYMMRKIRPPRLVRGRGRAGSTRPFRLTRTGTLRGGLALTATALGACAAILSPGPHVQTIALGLGRLPDALALDPGSGRAFVADDARATVSMLDLTAGRVVRTVAVGVPGTRAPLVLALDARTHRLFAANRGDGRTPSVVRVLDSRTGTALRTVYVGPGATALAGDTRADRVIVATWGDGGVSLLDARTGTVRRTTDVACAPVALAVEARLRRAFVATWCLNQGHELGAGRVSVLDTHMGTLVGTVAVGWGPCAVAASTRRAFVLNCGDHTVSVLDARSGQLLRTVAVGWHPCALVVDERSGRVFVVNADDGSVSVLDAYSGMLLHTRPIFHVGVATASAVLQPYALAVEAARDRVYLTAWGLLDPMGRPTGSGQLAVLDARTGTLLRTITLGVAPRAVAVDTRSGRVMVVDGGGEMRVRPGWLERWKQRVTVWAPWLGRLAQRPPDVARAPSDVQVIDPKA